MFSFIRDAVIAGLFLGFLFFFLLQAPSSAPRVAQVTIVPGAGFSDIADALLRDGFIRSSFAFRAYGFFSGMAHQLKPGTYIIRESLPAPRLFALFIKGPKEVSVTLFPGMTLAEIDARLASFSVIRSGALVAFSVSRAFHALDTKYPWLARASTLEGLLFPDTYSFLPLSDPAIVTKTFLDNFEKRVLTFLKTDDKFIQVLVMASLLEKEVPDYEERRIAAGIFEKRLVAGMPLQVDATVVYVRCGGKFLGCPPLREADYALASPYNTYVHLRLPPAPISNPGDSAIRAALSPQRSAYWYYLSDPKTKKTIFSKTLDEHNANRAKYLSSKN